MADETSTLGDSLKCGACSVFAFAFGSFPVDGFGPTYSAEMGDLHCLRRQEGKSGTRKSILEVVSRQILYNVLWAVSSFRKGTFKGVRVLCGTFVPSRHAKDFATPAFNPHLPSAAMQPRHHYKGLGLMV